MTSSKSCRRDPNPVLGYTTRRHLLLDLDNTSLSKVTKLARAIMDGWAKVGDCLICRSSHKDYFVRTEYYGDNRPFTKRRSDSYHLIFDNGIGYNLCVKICEALAALGALERDYVKIRKFRGDMTLRTSPTVLMADIKPPPAPVHMIYNDQTKREDGYIWQYLSFLRACRRFFGFDLDAEEVPDNGTNRADARRE